MVAYSLLIFLILWAVPTAAPAFLASVNQSQDATKRADRDLSGSAISPSEGTSEKAGSALIRDASDTTEVVLTHGSRVRPDWLERGAERVGGEYRVPVPIGPYASPVECEAHLPAAVEAAIDDYVEIIIGPEARGRVKVPWAFVEMNLLRERYMESRLFQLTSTQQREMHTLYVLLTFDHNANQYLREIWRLTQGTMNLVRFGAFFGIAVWTLAILWSYLRLDLASQGRYRWALCAAASVLVVLPWLVLAIFPIG